MRHKVVLYNPKAVFWTMPLALLAIGSALDRERFEVIVIDGRLESHETLLQACEGALCVGLTVLTGKPLADALAATRLIQQRLPQLPIVWGGWHPSLFAEMCVHDASLTAAVSGQGEVAFAQIVDRLAANDRDLSAIPGCSWRDPTGSVVHNLPSLLIDINRFPSHDYGLIDVERTFADKGRRQFDYISSQGCRFRCSFCADPAVYRRGWHGLAAERVVSELAGHWRRYRFDDLAFQDETYFTYPQRVGEIAAGFLQQDLRFSWFGTLRADQGRRLDDAIWALCKRSGLRTVMIGLEAGSQQTIDHIQKDIRVEDMWITAEKLLRHDIGAIINVIVGFPGESAASVDETLRVARELRALSPKFDLSVFYFKPYPGNPIVAELQRNGYQLPQTLEAWADFDYIGSGSQWLSADQQRQIEHFKFYQRLAYGPPRRWRRPLQQLARWRVERASYRLPLERRLIEWLKPSPALS